MHEHVLAPPNEIIEGFASCSHNAEPHALLASRQARLRRSLIAVNRPELRAMQEFPSTLMTAAGAHPGGSVSETMTEA